METPESNKRKRYSPSHRRTPDSSGCKKKPTHSSTEPSTPSLSKPPKLIDQLFQTYQKWKTAGLSANQIRTSQKDQKSQTGKILTTIQSGIKEKQLSLEEKSFALQKKKAECCMSQIKREKEQNVCVETVNNGWELVNLIYEDIKYIYMKENCFDQHFKDVSEIKATIIEKLKEKNQKLKIIPITEGNLETEIDIEKSELENLIRKRWNVKEKEEKLQIPEIFSVNSLEQQVENTQGFIKNLNFEEIASGNVLQEKNNLSLEEDSKFSQVQQELEKEFSDLETELISLGEIDKMQESANLKMNEIISRILIPNPESENNFTAEFHQIAAKVKELEIKSDLQKENVNSTNELLKVESNLIDSRNAINLMLSTSTDVDNLDKSLMQVMEELELLQSKETFKENELKNQDLEILIRRQRKNYDKTAEILQELNQVSNFEKEESIIRGLELELAQSDKVRNEIMQKYNNMKQENNEHLNKNPNLLEAKSLQNFAAIKKKSEETISSAQHDENMSEKKYDTKLKVLEHKLKKYLAALKEIDQEFNLTKENSKDHEFESLQQKIREAEEKLKKKKNDRLKRALPVVRQSESVKIDLETLALIKTIKKKLPDKPEFSPFSEDKLMDSDERFYLHNKIDQDEPNKLNNSQNSLKKDLDKEVDLLPLSQAKVLSSYSADFSESASEDGYSFGMTQLPSSQASFDDLISAYSKSSSINSCSQGKTELPITQTSFVFESKPEKKITSFTRSQSKVEISTPLNKARVVKDLGKERSRSIDRKFFKSSSQTNSKNMKRSKSVPPRRT